VLVKFALLSTMAVDESTSFAVRQNIMTYLKSRQSHVVVSPLEVSESLLQKRERSRTPGWGRGEIKS